MIIKFSPMGILDNYAERSNSTNALMRNNYESETKPKANKAGNEVHIKTNLG